MDTGNEPNVHDLGLLRKQIDGLDAQIVDLLNKRADVVVQIGQSKQTSGSPIYAPDREHAVLKRLDELNSGPLPKKTLRAIYRELMSGSFALEKPLRIGYLGPEGSFSNIAAARKFGVSVDHIPLADIRAVFDEVSHERCDLGVVPIENSVGGGVIATLDSFVESDVHVCAEIVVEVHHNLLAKCSSDEITAIASKPEVFAQCRNWLSSRFNQIDLLPVASTAKAAEMAVDRPGLAAIGSSLAAEIYDLRIVFAGIEDRIDNMTRFFVISKTPAARTGDDTTALVFTSAHHAGALVDVLNVFSRQNINLTNIITRPSMKRNWEYYFFVNADGHYEDPNFFEAIEEARELCGEMHVLGSFPRATEPIG
jgi:chorismate mutase / prephenate dehydratase